DRHRPRAPGRHGAAAARAQPRRQLVRAAVARAGAAGRLGERGPMSRRAAGAALALALVLAASACNDDAPPCASVPGHVCALAGTGELGFNRDGLPPPQTDLFLLSSVRRGPD